MVETVLDVRGKAIWADYEESLGFDLPDNFESIIKKELREGDIMRLSRRDLKELKKILTFWRKNVFIDKEAYQKFAIASLVSLIQIHCVAISTNPELRSYVGRFGGIDDEADVFKETYVVTTIMSTGRNGTNASFSNCPSKYRFS